MKNALLLLLLCITMSSTVIVVGDYREGNSRVGIQMYAKTGFINSEDFITIVVATELPNNSYALSWQATILISASNPNITFYTTITDSHMGIAPDIKNPHVIPEDDRVGQGEKQYGPYLVLPRDPNNYGDLFWTITVSSLDGKEIYVKMVFQWGFGTEAPNRIGDEDLSLNDNAGQYGTGSLFFIAILSAIAVFTGGQVAFKKATNKTVPKTEGHFKEEVGS